MIRGEEIKPGYAGEDSAWIVHYATAKRQGSQRFATRAKATAFAVELYEELLEVGPPQTV